MSTEAFVWRYERGEHAMLPLCDVLTAFQAYTSELDLTTGRLRLQFVDPNDICDLHLALDQVQAGQIRGITVLDPIVDSRFWECVLAVMRLGHVILFFSDQTTPRYTTTETPENFPSDLLESLGTPMRVTTPREIIDSVR